MDLHTTPSSRCLDRRLLIAGYEIVDLFAIFITLSILNFLFGNTHSKILLVWLPSILLALILRLGKRGKPDGYLVHWLRFQFAPGRYSAFDEDHSLSP